MIDPMTVLAILAMAGVTYLTRVGGYVVLKNRAL
ncbi:MAG: AzlD family protein, partial [Mesorhizobium sp.]